MKIEGSFLKTKKRFKREDQKVNIKIKVDKWNDAKMVAWEIMNPTCIIKVRSEMIFWKSRVSAQGEGTF